MSTLSRKVESTLKVQRAENKFLDNLGHNSRNLLMFQYSSDLPQVKQNLISSITNLVCKLPRKLPNDLRHIIKGVRKFANLRGNIVLCPVSLNFGNSSGKIIQKWIPNFSSPIQFYSISLLCSKYFVWVCSAHVSVYKFFDKKYEKHNYYSHRDENHR